MIMNYLRKVASTTPPWVIRAIGNFYAPFIGAGIRTSHVSQDYTEVDVQMKLTWYNRNYVGTQFGGSLYAMTDPFYMLMLINTLGRDYVVWDKAASIKFIKPGRGTVYAKFRLSAQQIAEIKSIADSQEKYVFDLPVDIKDKNGELIAYVIKTMYVKRKTTK
jgi:acyl-coenzyme A thioesterase PaaI-like protein